MSSPPAKTKLRAATRRKATATTSGEASRETYHHGDLRRALVDAALELVSESGVESFSLREAARRVGVNHRAAYRHFADKRDLLAAVAEQGWWELVDALGRELARFPHGTPRERLAAFARAYVLFALERSAHYTVMLGPRLNEDGAYPAIETPIGAATGILERELATAVPASRRSNDDVRTAGLSLWAAVHGTATLLAGRRIRVKRALLPAYVDELLRPVIDGLVA